MPQARPYGVDTPLNRMIDFISPESFAARSLPGEAVNLQHYATVWQSLDVDEGPVEVRPAIEAMRQVGDVVHALVDGQLGPQACRAQLQDLYGPHGEFVLAAVPTIVRWCVEQQS